MANRIRPILLALKTRVEAAGFAVGGTTLPVLLRKAPVRRQQMDPARAITISKSRTPERVSRRTFRKHQTEYVIDVTVVSPATGPDGDTSEYEAIRDGLVDLLDRPPLPGAPDVFELDAQPASWLQPFAGAAQMSEWDWFSVQVTATVAHA